ncbi:hypothetical protein BW723_09260 [Polaribacter reichenbachii]|uniref:Uncharacterized protein n=1 Tax=Polaribacter reichenbachii TaxID=996801 RepID=A0A1B8U7D4_9FLAO|nr:hypothetical protein [Polaribacter reichenbachii]APZ46472.1 hypothetical protein BW723_09260 [Polaribacter reichenbachii]AUC20337.1 hypothetical protein BTO17_17295 [Polaribacter reichenbachii]OBY67761.1 hypothetical protein LPB301_00240 [Polaribacter reichenbachii]
MENVLKYYEFSEFFKDNSSAFSGNEIAYTELNATHFLIFEKNNATYNLYVSKYQQRKDIGLKPPEILELLVENYDKSIPEHRIAIKQYLN